MNNLALGNNIALTKNFAMTKLDCTYNIFILWFFFKFQIMIFIFLAVVYILLINLLIAMMGDTYGFVASIPNEWIR